MVITEKGNIDHFFANSLETFHRFIYFITVVVILCAQTYHIDVFKGINWIWGLIFNYIWYI